MKSLSLHPQPASERLAWLLFPISLLITLFLFYIDEGRYTLEGLFEAGNLIAMALYFIFICATSLVFYQLFIKIRSQVLRIILATVFGLPVGFGLTVALIYFLRVL